MKLLSVLKHVLGHPLNRRARVAALCRFLRWQLATKLLPEAEFVLPFVDDSRLLVKRGMAGATGNFYCGLFEQNEMAFVRHGLVAGDLFVDVGANIGSFTVLAADRGAQVIAIEPIPAAHARLVANVQLNDFGARVVTRRVGVGDCAGLLRFSQDQDTVNHVLTTGEGGCATEVEVVTLDSLLAGRNPTMLKIDVEGYELPVLRGAGATLRASSLLAVIMETNGSGLRYGASDAEIYGLMAASGFDAYVYDGPSRMLRPVDTGCEAIPENSLFLRRGQVSAIEARVRQAASTRLVNGEI